jgi:hypothetical protein
MKCPHCGGTGQIPDDALSTVREFLPTHTNPLAGPIPSVDRRLDRVMSRIRVLDSHDTSVSPAWKALWNLRPVLRIIFDSHILDSKGLMRYFNCEGKQLNGKINAMKGWCRTLHRELYFNDLIIRERLTGGTQYQLTPLGEMVAAPMRKNRPWASESLILDVEAVKDDKTST